MSDNNYNEKAKFLVYVLALELEGCLGNAILWASLLDTEQHRAEFRQSTY